MKKKKSMIFLALLVAVFVLGVGYAAVTGVNLTLSGSAAAKAKGLDVAFNGSTDSDQTVGSGATITPTASEHSLTANIAVTNLESVGDTITATYTIENYETDVAASLTTASITNTNSEYFEVTSNIPTSSGTPVSLAAGGTTDLVVTVRLIKTPVTSQYNSTDITVVVNAAPVDNHS